MNQIQIKIAWVWELGFAQQEGKKRGGRTWWVLVAGEGPQNKGLGTAASRRPPSRRHQKQMERTRGARENDAREQKQGRRVNGLDYGLPDQLPGRQENRDIFFSETQLPKSIGRQSIFSKVLEYSVSN
jgi:hypothetical protein